MEKKPRIYFILFLAICLNGINTFAQETTLINVPVVASSVNPYAQSKDSIIYEAGETLGEVKSFTTNAVNETTAMHILSGSFLNYWQAIKTYNIGKTADVMANHSTSSWGSHGWLDNSWEPRIPWNNSPTYNLSSLTLVLWDELYGLLTIVNDVIDAIENHGLQIGKEGQDTPMVLATMYFIRGVSLGQLGLTFDQAWLATSNDLPNTNPFSPWSQIIDGAIDALNYAITLSNNNTFRLPVGTVSGILVNNMYLSQLANSYAARFLALGSRTHAQNEDLSWSVYDWSNVLEYANEGLTTDFAPIGNGLPWEGGTWWDLNIKYLRQPGWGRVDMRVVNLLDPDQPPRFPTDFEGLPILDELPDNGVAKSLDARLTTDFLYLSNHNFAPSRGGWHFSHYRHSRYDFPATTNTEGLYMGESLGPLRELRAYDNELMKAEAFVRKGNISSAAAILNDESNPRKARGQLEDVPDDPEELLNAIFYERDIELFHNGYLISFSDMRRRDMLQKGTPLHFPVPGIILKQMDEEIYTFGGYFNADGINTSNGGEWIKPFYHFVELELEIVGNGSTNIEEGFQTINKGEIEISAFPDQGYEFEKWIVNGNIELTTNPLNYNLLENTQIQVHFIGTSETQYDLTLSVNGTGDIQPAEGTYYLKKDETIILNAIIVDPQWQFVNWTNADQVEVSDLEQFTFTMPGHNFELVANFEHTTDIIHSKISDLKVYPNPFKDLITIKNVQTVKSLVITNLLGQVILEKKLNEQDTFIKTDNFEQGLYILIFQDKNGSKVVRRMVKE